MDRALKFLNVRGVAQNRWENESENGGKGQRGMGKLLWESLFQNMHWNNFYEPTEPILN